MRLQVWIILAFSCIILGQQVFFKTMGFFDTHLLSDKGAFQKDTQFFTFYYLSCYESVIWFLSQNENFGVPFYKAIVGGWSNTKSQMRRNIYSDAVADIEILQTVAGAEMNCSDVRQFWVSWENGELKIGRGSIQDVEIILNVKQECPYDIQNIGLSGGPYDAYWLFNKTTPIEPEQKQITTRVITKYATINGCPLFRIISSIYNVSLIECIAFCAQLTNCNRVQFTRFHHSCTGLSSEASSKGIIPNYISAM